MLAVLGVLTVGFGGFVFWTTREMWRTNVGRLPEDQARAATRRVAAVLMFGVLVFVVSAAGSPAAALALAGAPLALSVMLALYGLVTGCRKRLRRDG